MMEAPLQTAKNSGATCPRSGAAAIAAGLDGADVSWLDEGAFNSVSVEEISELISGALQDAMLAAEQPCPATYLGILERRKRDRIVARMNELPSVQLAHPVVHAEVLKNFAMMRGQNKLANGIVECIRNYACSKRRALNAAMT